MGIKVVLVEPEYDINVGSICRVMKNFGFSDLVLVRPKCPLGLDAVKYAKHAVEILQGAKKFDSLDSATKDCELIIGTSGIVRRNKETLRSLVELKHLDDRIIGKDRNIALVFGNEGIGLNASDISKCDFLVKIETSDKYPVMNLSHAVGIVLYEVSKIVGIESKIEESAGKEQKQRIVEYTKEVTEIADVRAKKYVVLTMKRIVGKANLTKKEANFLLGFLNDLKKKLN